MPLLLGSAETLEKMSLRLTISNGLRKAYKVQLCTTGKPHIPRLAPAAAAAAVAL